jgi:hypothetical protein
MGDKFGTFGVDIGKVQLSERAQRLLAAFEALVDIEGHRNYGNYHLREFGISLEGRVFTLTWPRWHPSTQSWDSAIVWDQDIAAMLRKALLLEEELQESEASGK